jgi:nucleoside diphosphate kinase
LSQTLSYVIVTPYSIVKSRTGGVLSRLLSRTDMELVGAQMITPDVEFARQYAALVRETDPGSLNSGAEMLAEYIERNMGPSGGRRHRSLILVFRGEHPCDKLSQICGALFQKNQGLESVKIESLNLDSLQGESIRDTYADLVYSPEESEKIIYFEPAVLTSRKQELADKNLSFFIPFLRKSENVVSNMIYPDPSKIERTLVIIKPDNWKYASSRPGAVIDMFSRTGLRIVGIKLHRFSLKQALEFYGPVESSLKERLAPVYGQKAREILETEFHISLKGDIEKALANSFGIEYAEEQFRSLIEFMSGLRPDTCPSDKADKPGNVMCLILVYEGEDAVKKIRDVLGPTDPLKAPGGTVRREFGSNVMANTAHASDSRESYEREKEIVHIDENPLADIITNYLKERNA